MRIEELKEEIKNIREPRRTRYGNIRHKLEDIIIIGLCTIICGGEDYADMEAFGKSRQEYLAKFLELPNEITAVPELLDLIDVKGDIVTADAMSCQKKIVEKIIDRKADYTIGLKQNQPALYKDTEDYFKEFSANISSKATIEKGHGRIEKREYQLLTDLSWLEQKNEWKRLNALGCARSTITENGEIREFTRYFITSLTVLETFADSVRKHWAIENQLHWCLDVVFREDASRARKDNSPLNLNVLRKTALNLISQAQYKRISKKRLMFRAALKPTLFFDILFDPSSISPQK